jgi:diacylglycerol kinase (ATP)
LIRTGIIWNPKSRRNQGAGGPPTSPPGVLTAVAAEPEALVLTLARFASGGVELIVIDGGDGTIREVVSRIPEAFGARRPRLTLLPTGKTNALALDLGIPHGWTLEDALAAAGRAERPVKVRRPLEVVRAGAASPELRGFVFGTGAFVRGTELAKRPHGLGVIDNLAVALTFVDATAATLFGGARAGWRAGEPMQLALGDRPGHDAARFLVLASTLKRMPLGLKPFGTPRDGLKLLAVAAPPKRLHAALPILLAGRDANWLAAAGYERADVEEFHLSWAGEFVLDGEAYPGGDLTVRAGQALEFVAP